MAEQIAFMHESGSIPRLGAFPGGCSVRYDDATWEVLEVKPFEPASVETQEQEVKPEGADENATQPLESPTETPQETVAPVEEPHAPTQITNGG